MPYERDLDNFITESPGNVDHNPGFDDSDSLSVRNSLFLSGDQQTGESDSSSETGEDSEYNTDYSDILGNIDSNTTLSLEQIESIVVQVDNLNENIVTLNENLKIGIGLAFVIVIILGIRIIFTIFNKILGLGSC